MSNVEKHINRLLGFKVKDRVTGFSGVVTSIGFDLYGCIQAIVHPGLDKDNKVLDSHYFDINRLEITSTEPVMKIPNFAYGPQAEGEQGAAEKPRMNRA
jgi:hypothetical protein